MKESDLWNKLVEEAGQDEIERAASVTVAEAEAELRAAGFDVAAERAKAEAFLRELAPPDKVAAPRTATVAGTREKTSRRARPERHAGTPRVTLVATAVVAAAAGALLYATAHPTPEPAARPTPVTSAPPDLAAAAELRRVAAADCDARQWGACLAHLDQARGADLAGDEAPPVRSLRDRALAGILARPRAP